MQLRNTVSAFCFLLLAQMTFAQQKSTTVLVQDTLLQDTVSKVVKTSVQPQKAQNNKTQVTRTQPSKTPVKTQPIKYQTKKPTTGTHTTVRPTTTKNQPAKGKKSNVRVTTLDAKQYRGMADMGFSWGIGDGKEFNRFGFSTTHGYQVVPIYLFIGGGIEVDYYSDGNGFAVPLYLDLRTNFKAKVSPFIDARVGGSPFDLKGFYVSPSVGVRIPIKQTKYGISLMAGYTLQTADLGYYYYSKDVTTVDKKKMGGIHFKVGFEW